MFPDDATVIRLTSILAIEANDEWFVCFFFFQAEDGIRDHCVTGVQTCALPIFGEGERVIAVVLPVAEAVEAEHAGAARRRHHRRSEERRVGKECRSRWSPY